MLTNATNLNTHYQTATNVNKWLLMLTNVKNDDKCYQISAHVMNINKCYQIETNVNKY